MKRRMAKPEIEKTRCPLVRPKQGGKTSSRQNQLCSARIRIGLWKAATTNAKRAIASDEYYF